MLLAQRALLMRDYGIKYDMPGLYTDEGLKLAGIYNLKALPKKKVKENTKRLNEKCAMWD